MQKIVQFNLADIGEGLYFLKIVFVCIDDIDFFLFKKQSIGIAEVEMLEWFIEEGQTVEQFDRLCEVQVCLKNHFAHFVCFFLFFF